MDSKIEELKKEVDEYKEKNRQLMSGVNEIVCYRFNFVTMI
jgi:hypothetical protein